MEAEAGTVWKNRRSPKATFGQLALRILVNPHLSVGLALKNIAMDPNNLCI